MEIDIIAKINECAQDIVEMDLDDWVIPKLMEHYQSRIDSHAARVYGGGINLARNAFRETAKATIRNGLSTFLFKSQHWRSGRDINTYLLTCLKRLADQTYWDQSSAKRANMLICPACRELGAKVFLTSEAKSWRCANCTSEADRLQDQIKKGKDNMASVRGRIRLHKAFSIHSRRGYRCPEPDCARFIPESLNGRFGIECPYQDCSFFGKVESLGVMSHPSALTHRQMLSLNQPLASHNNNNAGVQASFQDIFEAEMVMADEQISISQNYQKEYLILLSVIESQIESVKRMNNYGTRVQKLLMYEAFKSMCHKNPDEMVSYLVHLKQNTDAPIQVRIFQEYICLVEEALPFVIERRGEKIEIFSISDANLGLFMGLSTFDAVVEEGGKIPNNTIETYAGSRQFKHYGSCFIGKLVDVVNVDTGESLGSHVKGNSFIDIDTDLAPGTNVRVTHYRIPPHYEMGSLVYLQRIRRHLVDKVYFRLHGKKRIVVSNDVKNAKLSTAPIGKFISSPP